MYQHTQRSPAAMLLLLLAALIPIVILLVGGVAGQFPLGVRLTLMVIALIMLTTAFVFSSLTVAVRNGQLSWWFGPGVVKKTVPLSEIVSAEPTTTTIFNGWGIHLTMRGWLYNIAGRQAVHVTLQNGSTFLLGTDEPEALAQAITTGARKSR